ILWRSDSDRSENRGEGQGKICPAQDRSCYGEGKNRTGNGLHPAGPGRGCQRHPLPGIAQAVVNDDLLLSESRLGRCLRGNRVVSVGRAQFRPWDAIRFVLDTHTSFPSKCSACGLDRGFCRGDEVGFISRQAVMNPPSSTEGDWLV